MAANSQIRGVASLGKRFVNEIRAGSSRYQTQSPSLTLSRALHASSYDKNPDEQVPPTVVPDEIIQPESEKYWAPDPKTGVFGPASEQNLSGGERGFHSSPVDGAGDSVLEQKAFFRPLEDLEKPTHP
ncbi:late embryogenesis abundant protein At5g17165-like [Cornus florida]|uniref:late embryogenesis abundant protein At5g17165-like n=1 Tax=Cornus florida TaxID=4283 RepID=UPI00289E28CD|nr:late embryogenesis abundant protein At5g17165-like [Cornus florida]